MFPGCAAPNSSVDSHLLIVVRRGRGWEKLSRVWFASIVSRSFLSFLAAVGGWLIIQSEFIFVRYTAIS